MTGSVSGKISGKLYCIATPIGNLQDISARALKTLEAVDAILCEDTRHTAKLLFHFGIKKTLIACHEYSSPHELQNILARLESGESLGLVTDAGTPAISDPGARLVELLIKAGIQVIPIPGPSAGIALLSVSGFNFDRFTFFGFPPVKKGRNKFFLQLANCDHVGILFESTHRIIKTLIQLEPLQKELCVGRELTKQFETIYRGTAQEIIPAIEASSIKGEFTIIFR